MTTDMDLSHVRGEQPPVKAKRAATMDEAAAAFPNTERSAANMVACWLRLGMLEEAFELPKIAHYELEFPLPRGRADVVLFHEEGTITVIELKGPLGAARDILAGIGQLVSYKVQLSFSRPLPVVRMILAAMVIGEGNGHLLETCRAAGVRFIPLGTPQEYREAAMGTGRWATEAA